MVTIDKGGVAPIHFHSFGRHHNVWGFSPDGCQILLGPGGILHGCNNTLMIGLHHNIQLPAIAVMHGDRMRASQIDHILELRIMPGR